MARCISPVWNWGGYPEPGCAIHRTEGLVGDSRARAKGEWQLTKPLTDYAGKYANDLMGKIEIVAKEKALAVQMGNINTVATPFTQSDTIRVVMLPGGNGEVIGFVKDTEGNFGSLNYAGVTFTKVAK